MDKVSIITVCFNESEDRIRMTFDSIFTQIYKNLEVIVIDGGSKQSTLNVLNEYSSRFDYLLSEKDKGIFDAMNKGLEVATGTWIGFMNIGDVFYSPESLLQLIYSKCGDAKIIYGNLVKNKLGFVLSPKKLNRYVFYSSGICHQALIVRSSVFSQVGKFDLSTNLYGDADWIFKAYVSGISFCYVPIIVCIYDGYGATSDSRKLVIDRNNFLIKYFKPEERLLFYILSKLGSLRSRILKYCDCVQG